VVILEDARVARIGPETKGKGNRNSILKAALLGFLKAEGT